MSTGRLGGPGKAGLQSAGGSTHAAGALPTHHCLAAASLQTAASRPDRPGCRTDTTPCTQAANRHNAWRGLVGPDATHHAPPHTQAYEDAAHQTSFHRPQAAVADPDNMVHTSNMHTPRKRATSPSTEQLSLADSCTPPPSTSSNQQQPFCCPAPPCKPNSCNLNKKHQATAPLSSTSRDAALVQTP